MLYVLAVGRHRHQRGKRPSALRHADVRIEPGAVSSGDTNVPLPLADLIGRLRQHLAPIGLDTAHGRFSSCCNTGGSWASMSTNAMRQVHWPRLTQACLVPCWMTTSPARS